MHLKIQNSRELFITHEYTNKLSKYVINKSWSPFFVFFNEENEKVSINFLHRKMTLKVKIVLFSTFNSKTTETLRNAKNIFMAVFIVLTY